MNISIPQQHQNKLTPSTRLEQYLPLLLPFLLMFSRALADITVLLVGLAFLMKSYRFNDWQWVKHTWVKLSLLFWAYLLCINVPLSIDSQDSLIYAITYMRWPLFASALAYWILANKTSQRQLLISLLIVSTFVMLDTSLQYFIGHDILGHTKASPTRLTGPYTRPIPGIMLLRIWFISMFASLMLPQLKQMKHRLYLLLSMLFIGLVFMFITGERMALILSFAGSITVVTGLLFSFKHQKIKIIGGLLLVIGLLTSLVIIAPDTAERSVYSISIKLAHFSSSDYGVVFRAAIAAWREHFLLGSGLHTYKQFVKT